MELESGGEEAQRSLLEKRWRAYMQVLGNLKREMKLVDSGKGGYIENNNPSSACAI